MTRSRGRTEPPPLPGCVCQPGRYNLLGLSFRALVWAAQYFRIRSLTAFRCAAVIILRLSRPGVLAIGDYLPLAAGPPNCG